MKKIIAGLTLALVVALALPVALVGCKTNPYGTYKIYNLTFSAPADYEGSAPTEEQLQQELANMKEAGTSFTLNKNGTAVAHNMFEEEDMQLTWEKKSDGYHFYTTYTDKETGETSKIELEFIGTVKNGKLTLSMEFDGAKESIIFKK